VQSTRLLTAEGNWLYFVRYLGIRNMSSLNTSQEMLSPRASTDEPRSGEEDVEIDWVLAYDFDDIGTELRDLGVWQLPAVLRVRD
jgi:hypothetical protein